MMVTLPDGRDFEAELVGTDNVTDVAVLKIEADSLSVAPLGTSQGLLIGEWTVAIGNPFGNLMSYPEPSVTAGVISAVGRHIIPSSQEDGFYLGMIQTDASINPGNSGGPLVNALGEVIGVNSSIFSVSGGNEGLGFAIPIDRALRVAGDLIRHGEVQRAWLGVQVEPVEADAWGRTRGVRISAVAQGSPADGEGLDAGSNILAANGSRVATPLDFEAKLLDLRAGDAITLQIEGRLSPLRIVASTLPSVTAERVTVLEDLELITVTPEIRAERNVRSEVGALVAGISPELNRILALRTGDVLLMVNQARISTAEEANQAFRAVAGRGRVRIYAERNGQVLVHTFNWGR
jgi:serine protease Do